VSLADTQRAVRRAVVDRDTPAVLALIGATANPRGRLAIHQRHYEASLVSTLLTRHPATTWLLGGDAVTSAARGFVRRHPPKAPCLAEYGRDFSAWLGAGDLVSRVPYVAAFAELDWQLGRVSVEVERPPLPVVALSAVEPAASPGIRFQLQPGLHYLEAEWPIDELMRMFLTDAVPERLTFTPGAVTLEIRGARGTFGFTRIRRAEWVFRRSLQRGDTLGTAIDTALRDAETFDPGPAVGRALAAGLIHAIRPAAPEMH
jgi:hypothetical protein